MPDVECLSREKFLPFNNIALKVSRITDHEASSKQHTHEFEELVIITAGSAAHWVEDQRYHIVAGDVFVILGNTRHCYQETQKLGLINILFDAEALRIPRADIGAVPGYQALFEIEPRVRRRKRFTSRLRLEIKRLEELLLSVSELERELRIRAPGYQFAATAQWMRITAFVARAYSEKEEDASPMMGLSRVLSHLEQHIHEAQTVDQLARVAGMSPAALYREFKEFVGCSPIEHLLRLRMDRAKRLLRDPRMRIGEVSEAVGFEDSNYFARQFRRHVGMTAREWQKFAASTAAPSRSMP